MNGQKRVSWSSPPLAPACRYFRKNGGKITVMKVALVVIFCVLSLLYMASAQAQNITIRYPSDGASVPELPIIEGSVSDNTAQVWVIVHPMETADYWVQPKTSVRRTGLWRVQVHIGRPGNIDVGKHFEIAAVANPAQSLREGLVLGTWPRAQWQSDVIEVKRR